MSDDGLPAHDPAGDEDPGERTEHRWAILATAIVTLLVVMAAFAGVHQMVLPQSRIETADPSTLHLKGEFIESNLGSALLPDGSVVVRAIGQQFSFTPECILVPTDTPINFRVTSADVVHGFLITGTTINLMLVPGYISSIPARFSTPGERHMPCHEFCGLGHEGMWGRIKVIDKSEFARLAKNTERLSCVAQ
jgi:cytochrome c oxidase subunit II